MAVSTRLTQTMRQDIRHELRKRAYVERKAEVKAMEHALARAVYDLKYTSKEQAAMMAMDKKFFAYRDIFRVEWSKGWNNYSTVSLADKLPVAYDDNNSTFFTFNDPKYRDHPVLAQYEVWKKAKESLDNDVEKAEAEAYSMLEACSTVKKLCAEWPEICPLLKQMGIKPEKDEVYLPALRHDANDIFSLPPKTPEQHVSDALDDIP